MSIAGYTYNAEQYCPDDILRVGPWSEDGPWSAESGTEDILTTYAELHGISRDDERIFDSSEFPKIIYSYSVHDVCCTEYDPGQCGDACATCHQPLDGPCPNQRVESYRCPCCGDDVMCIPPICADCRDAGCEETTDAGGEAGYWGCERLNADPIDLHDAARGDFTPGSDK